MNKNMQTFLAITAAIFIAGGSLALGALTAPPKQPETKKEVVAQPKKQSSPAKIKDETPAILSIIQTAYPKIITDYTIGTGKLYNEGKWYGTTLTYKGTDTNNRDTLRVLLQKKGESWIIRTTPPEPILSAKKYPDVPISVLKAINKPVSLPGTDNSPTITPTE